MGVETAAYAAVALMAAGTYVSYEAAQESAAAQKDQIAITKKQNASRLLQERRQQIREARIKSAQIAQAASNTGASGSSAEQGTLNAIKTQLGGNMASLQYQNVLSSAMAKAQTKEANAGEQAAMGTALQNTGSSLFYVTGGSIFQ